MDALVPAMLLGILLMLASPSPGIALTLAGRSGATGRVLPAILLVHAIGNGIAVAAALWLAPLMTLEARRLMLALALLFAAGAQLLPRRQVAGAGTTHRYPAIAGVLLVAGPALGDSLQFATGALALQQGRAVQAWLGAVIGVALAHFAALLLGRDRWQRLSGPGVRVGIAILLLICGMIVGLTAFRLI